MATSKTGINLPAHINTIGDAASDILSQLSALQGGQPPDGSPPPSDTGAPAPVIPPGPDTPVPAAVVTPETPPAELSLTDAALLAIGVQPKAPAAPPVAPTAPDAAAAAAAAAADAQEAEAVARASRFDPKIGHTFAKLRTELKASNGKIAEMETKLAEATKGGTMTGTERAALAKQIEDAEAKNADLEERLGRVSLEASPKFQAKFDLRIQSAGVKLAQSLAQFAGVEAAEAPKLAATLLQATPAQLDEHLAKMSPSIGGIVMGAWQDVRGALAEKSAAIADWRKTNTAIQVEQSQTQTEASIRERQTLAASALEDAATAGCFVYQDLGTPESKAAVDRYRTAFLGFVQTADHKELIRKAADGFAAPTLYRVIELQAQRIRELSGDRSDRIAVTRLPVSGGSGFEPPPPAPAKPAYSGSVQDMRDEIARKAAEALGGGIR